MKGIKKNVIKKDIKHKNYKDILFNNKQVYHKMKTIQSQRHHLGSYEINKISLSKLASMTDAVSKISLSKLASMTNAIYMTMECAVTLLVITRYNSQNQL